jgi:hypothetical protein
VGFVAITLCVASQRVFVVVVYFVIDSVRKLLDIPSYSWICKRMNSKESQNMTQQYHRQGVQRYS